MSLMPNTLSNRLAVMHWAQSRGAGHQELQKCYQVWKIFAMKMIFFVLNFIPCFKFNLFPLYHYLLRSILIFMELRGGVQQQCLLMLPS